MGECTQDDVSLDVWKWGLRFLRDNYVHGDLHGGNLMAADDGTLAVPSTLTLPTHVTFNLILNSSPLTLFLNQNLTLHPQRSPLDPNPQSL